MEQSSGITAPVCIGQDPAKPGILRCALNEWTQNGNQGSTVWEEGACSGRSRSGFSSETQADTPWQLRSLPVGRQTLATGLKSGKTDLWEILKIKAGQGPIMDGIWDCRQVNRAKTEDQESETKTPPLTLRNNYSRARTESNNPRTLEHCWGSRMG